MSLMSVVTSKVLEAVVTLPPVWVMLTVML